MSGYRIVFSHCPEVEPMMIDGGSRLETPEEAEESACVGCPVPTSLSDLADRDTRECPASWLLVPKDLR